MRYLLTIHLRAAMAIKRLHPKQISDDYLLQSWYLFMYVLILFIFAVPLSVLSLFFNNQYRYPSIYIATIMTILLGIIFYIWLKRNGLIGRIKKEMENISLEQLKIYKRRGIIMYCIIFPCPFYAKFIYDLVKYYCL